MKDQQSYYYGEFTVRFDGSPYCEECLQTLFIDEETASLFEQAGDSVHRADFEDGILVRVEEYHGVEWQERELEPDEIGFQCRDIPIHSVFQFEYRNDGPHSFGGILPENFTMPSHPDLPVSMQYIGKFSKTDSRLGWLPFDELHLIYPLFASIGPLFFDYSEPLKPVILSDLKFIDHTFKCVTPDTYIEFEEKKFGSRPLELDPEYDNTSLKKGIGWGGVANWMQYPEIPRCPKSGSIMKFLAQFETTDIKAVRKVNVGPEDPQAQYYLDTLNFWCDGDLYIFFEPESKVLCLLIQNT